MSFSSIDRPEDIYDLVGLGFGPANLAIAGALTERWNSPDVSSLCPPLFYHETDKCHKHTECWHCSSEEDAIYREA
jgi:hypothetical protein